MSIEVLSVRGLRPEFREVDRDLWLWFCEAKKNYQNYHGPPVTKRLVQAKAKQAFEAAGIFNFKASDGWYIRWLKRWHRAKDDSTCNSEVQKKQRLRKSKTKTPMGLQQKGSIREPIATNFIEAGAISYSSTDSESVCLFKSTIGNYVGVPQPQQSDSLQSVVEQQSGFSFQTVNSIQVLHDAANGDSTSTDLGEECNIQNGAHATQPGQFNEDFVSDTSSLLNLDDFTWSDLSDLSSFGKLISGGNRQSGYEGPKSVTRDGDQNKRNIPSNITLPSEGQSSTISEKKLICLPRGKTIVDSAHVKHITNSAQDLNMNFSHHQVMERTRTSQGNGKGFGNSCQKALKLHAGIERSWDASVCNSISVARSAGVSAREIQPGPLKEAINTVNDGNYTEFVNYETSCANFSEHDIEDMSISSDFVDQLNDEQSLDLHIKCGNENVSQQISHKAALNSSSWNDASTKQPVLTDLVTSTEQLEASQASPESGCHISVVDDDLSSEDDYISEAVMLSMQEDDFSILNCDQSPFQGTISVIDENSQSESEKVKDLDEGLQGANVSDDNLINSHEILFPPLSSSQYDLMDKEHVFLCGGMKRTDNSIQSSHSILKSDSRFQLFEGQQEGFSADLVCNENLVADQFENVFDKSSCRTDKIVQSKNCEMIQILPTLNSVSTNGLLSANGDRCVMMQQDCSLSSSDISNDGRKVFQISSSAENIALCEGEYSFQIYSDGANSLLAEQDVFLMSSNNIDNVGFLPPACFSNEKAIADSQKLLISNSCSLSQGSEDIPGMYSVPYAPQTDTCSDVLTLCGTSNGILSNSGSPGMLKTLQCNSLGSQWESSSKGTFSNADSATVFLTPSSSDYFDDDNARLMTWTSPAPTLELSSKSVLNVEDAEVTVSDNTSSNPHNSNGPSTSPLSCESTKENGFISYDLQLVESVLSEQDDGPETLLQPTKKSAAYLTEKGNNTSRINSAVNGSYTSYRRSSGDRYFPYFKEKVVNYAVKHTSKEAARYFGVNVDTVTLWTRGRLESNSVVRNYPDQVMLRWLKQNRESGVVLTKEQVVQKALQLLKTSGNWLKDKNRWFHIWATRFAEEEAKKNQTSSFSQGVSPLPSDLSDKKALYPDDFKVEVVLYAERTSKNLASNIFNIARRRIFEWSAALRNSKKAQDDMASNSVSNTAAQGNKPPFDVPTPSSTSLSNSGTTNLKLNVKGNGRAVTNVDVDRELWLWFCEQTAKKSKPKSRDIRAKAVELFRARNHDKIQCSHGWLKKWSLRYGIALRHEGDSDLLAWCLEQFDCNRNISHRDLLNYAQESLTGTHKSEFKASAGWLLRFCKRHRSLLSDKPSIDTEIPTVLKHSVSEFRTQIQKVVYNEGIAENNVGSMDEIPLNFTAGGARGRLLLRRSGLENCHAVVILSCLANGELLPPAIIFKGEGPTEQVTCNGISLFIFYQQDCSMTTSVMLQWVDFVWTRNVSSPSVLVADCYSPHCSESVQNKCRASNVILSTIPAGCSFKLQPLDLAISRLFEANIYNRWTRHFTAADQLSTCKRTSYSSNTDIIRWVAEACSSLQQTRKEAVRRSFEVTGLTSALKKTEDHHLEDPSYIPFSSLFTSQSS